jgi:hypothetical protein
MLKSFALILALGLGLCFAAIPTTPGWYEIPGTKLQTIDACFNGFSYACGNSTGGIYAWSGGIFDTKRNRLLIHGGGHADYRGNEIYALTLDQPALTRITTPGSPTASGCQEAIANGTQPNSRHTYDGISYMDNVDQMYVFSGSLNCSSGNFGTWTWTFDFTTMTWTHVTPTGTGPNGAFGIVSSYDPNTGKVFVNDLGYLYAYDPVNNTYEKLTGSYKYGLDYHMCSVVDPKRKKFIMIGNGQAWSINIAAGSNYACSTLTTTGGSAIVSSGYPGLAYDKVRDRIVGWNGGNTVYSLDMDTKQWTGTTYTGGPGNANGNGTYKRWAYSAALDAFVLNNTYGQNSFTFRFPGSAAVQKNVSGQPAQVTISPNPIMDRAVISVKGQNITRAAVYNMRGQLVQTLEADPSSKSNAFTFRAGSLPGGVYLLKLKTNGSDIARTLFLSR